MELDIIQMGIQYGGLGVVALFAFFLLKSTMHQQERLGQLLDNHLTKLLERQETSNQLLSRLLDAFGQHEAGAVRRQEILLDVLKKAEDKG